MSHLLVRVAAMTAVLSAASACKPSSKAAPPGSQTEAKGVDAGRWEVQAVPMPDLWRLPQSVQAQVHDRYTALAEKTASPATPSEQLARAHGDVGLILMATGYHAAAETSLRNAQALAPNEAQWPYYLGQLFLLTSDRANAVKSFERALELEPKD